jgi:hypothetical protein
MSNRKLASIMTVKGVEPVEGKDSIGMVTFNECEWRVIGSRSLTPGEKVIYLEYDSIIPEKTLELFVDDTANMLKKRCWSIKHNGCYIRAMKMSGKISYGILFARNSFKSAKVPGFIVGQGVYADKMFGLPVGTDLTEQLGIFKKDDDATQVTVKEKDCWIVRRWKQFLWKVFKIKKKKSGLGEWFSIPVARTDETRIHALGKHIIESWRDHEIYVTEKIDGQSFTACIYKDCFYIASRNQVLYRKRMKDALRDLRPQNKAAQTDRFLQTACQYDLPKVMSTFKGRNGEYLAETGYAAQFEQYGEGIQKNPLGISGTKLNLFNILDLREGAGYYSLGVLESFYRHSGIEVVPVVYRGLINQFDTIEKLEELAEGTYTEGGKRREGIVIRKYVLGWDFTPPPERGMSNMASFKVIAPSYLIKNEKSS